VLESPRIVVVSNLVTRLGKVGDQDTGLMTPQNEDPTQRVYVTHADSAPATVADLLLTCYALVEDCQQRQYQNVNENVYPPLLFGVCTPIAPAPGAVIPANALAEVFNPATGVVTKSAFIAEAYTLPAVNSSDDLTVVDPGTIAVDDALYLPGGGLHTVTAVTGSVITITYTGAAAAVVSIGA